ncbi:MAG: hypothetical protein WBE93_05675 [Pseudolabrys sp.]
MKSNNKIPFDPKVFLSKVDGGRTMSTYRKNQNVYAQGDPADSEIIANRIIAAAKNGERDSVRLYEQALKVFGMDDTSMLVISVGAEGPHVNINYAERRAVR